MSAKRAACGVMVGCTMPVETQVESLKALAQGWYDETSPACEPAALDWLTRLLKELLEGFRTFSLDFEVYAMLRWLALVAAGGAQEVSMRAHAPMRTGRFLMFLAVFTGCVGGEGERIGEVAQPFVTDAPSEQLPASPAGVSAIDPTATLIPDSFTQLMVGPRHAGIFVAPPKLNANDSQTTINARLALLESPVVHGIFLRALWKDIRPDAGTYNFAMLTPYVEKAVLLDKKIGITVLFASEVPAWAEAADSPIPIMTFTVPENDGSSRTFKVAPPWNNNYITEFIDIHTNLKSYLNGKNALSSLAYIRLGAIATDGAELGLPRPNGAAAKADPNNVINLQWTGVGYKPSRVKGAFVDMLNSLSGLFSERVRLVQGIFEGDGFPQIDESGVVVSVSTTRQAVIDRVLNDPVLQPRFSVGDQSLVRVPEDRDDYEADFKDFVDRGAGAHFQCNHYNATTAGAGCPRATPTSTFDKTRDCQPSEFVTLLKTGFAIGDTIEVWEKDVMDHAAGMREAWVWKITQAGW